MTDQGLQSKQTEGIHKPNMSVGNIQDQLELILSSPEFHATDRQRDFLRFVISETVAGRQEVIKGYTIATEVFDRDDDFDQATDPVVSIQANKLRRALERYYLVAGQDDEIRIDIPKGTYVPTFHRQIQGASGLGAEDVHGAPTIFEELWPSVLVCPFKNLTGDPAMSYLGEGLAVELCLEMGRYPNALVVMHREGEYEKSPSDIRIRFAVNGSIRRDGNNARITVHLIDSTTGTQLWGDKITSPLESITLFAFQEDVARKISSRIAGQQGIIAKTLSERPKTGQIIELEAYHAALKYYAYDRSVSSETYLQAFEALSAVVDSNPQCSPIILGMLANLYADNLALEFFDIDQTPFDKAIKMAQESILHAPDNQLNRYVMARLRMQNNEMDVALVETEAALALHPKSLLYMDTIGHLLTLLGEWERGTALISEAIHFNPYYQKYTRGALWLNLFRLKHYQQALLETNFLHGVADFWDPLMRATTLGQLGQHDEGRKAVGELLVFKPDFSTRGRILIGHFVKFEKIAERIIEGLEKVGLEIQ